MASKFLALVEHPVAARPLQATADALDGRTFVALTTGSPPSFQAGATTAWWTSLNAEASMSTVSRSPVASDRVQVGELRSRAPCARSWRNRCSGVSRRAESPPRSMPTELGQQASRAD
jgi:hypothetical protein